MNALPTKLRRDLASDPFYKRCAREGLHGHECAGRITWEHAMYYAGTQLQKKWAIIPLCEKAHNCGPWQDRGDMNKTVNEWIALNRAGDEDLLPICKAKDYFLRRGFLNRQFGGPYIAPPAQVEDRIAY